jgi:hypothetical protein
MYIYASTSTCRPTKAYSEWNGVTNLAINGTDLMSKLSKHYLKDRLFIGFLSTARSYYTCTVSVIYNTNSMLS